MSGQARFGDFLQAAHIHLGQGPGGGRPVPARGSVEEVSASLLRVVTVMGRYLSDITAALDGVSRTTPGLTAWARAGIEAREALANAAGFLPPGPVHRRPGVPASSPLARSLDEVSAALTAGRDLLGTHFARGRRGGREHRSDWALVITSPAVTRALLSEVGWMSDRIARQGADLALAGVAGRREGVEARRMLNAACQWLWVAGASVRSAHQHEPVAAAGRDLLYAVPVNIPPPRRLPGDGEAVTGLCEGTISTAERLRHLAWDSASRAGWSPGMSITSLHQVAAAATATSHNCSLLLETLAARAGQAGPGRLREELLEAAEAARLVRAAWWRTARAVDAVTTDTRGMVPVAAAETRDLALWTGRLAYADPQWTPAAGPARPARSPEALAPEPGQVREVIAAVHYATDTLARIAQAEQEQVRVAAQYGRILVTTRSLPEEFDIPRPFARAPSDRVERLLSQYREAGQTSRQAVGALAGPAEAVRSPSRILTTARVAVAEAGTAEGGTAREAAATDGGGMDAGAKGSVEGERERARSAAPAGADQEELVGLGAGKDSQPRDAGARAGAGLAGPVERTLRDLGVTSPELLSRGAEIDEAGERLIIEAATTHTDPHARPSATGLSRSGGTAELINHALASGDTRAAALLRAPLPARRDEGTHEVAGRRVAGGEMVPEEIRSGERAEHERLAGEHLTGEHLERGGAEGHPGHAPPKRDDHGRDVVRRHATGAECGANGRESLAHEPRRHSDPGSVRPARDAAVREPPEREP